MRTCRAQAYQKQSQSITEENKLSTVCKKTALQLFVCKRPSVNSEAKNTLHLKLVKCMKKMSGKCKGTNVPVLN